jgi:hypothetical protein
VLLSDDKPHAIDDDFVQALEDIEGREKEEKNKNDRKQVARDRAKRSKGKTRE